MTEQFLGCWGYGFPQEIEVQLNIAIQQLSAKPLASPRSENQSLQLLQLLWNVVYIGRNSTKLIRFPTSHPIAAISASGNSGSPDAWVNVQGSDRLILAREPFGKVPLYWMQIGQLVWFASQLQLLLPLKVNPEISIPGLYGYSCFSYVPTPLTPVQEIFAVPAGIELIWQSDFSASRIFSPITNQLHAWREVTEKITDEARAVSELQTLLKKAVERLINNLSDQPVGVFLSGGLDSSVVAALLVQAGVKVRAYTLDFGLDFGLNSSSTAIPEYHYAEQVAQFLDIPLVKVDASSKQIKKFLIPTVKALDLPFGDGVTVPLYLLSQTASRETQVIFNGEGGDQLFAGWTNKPLIAALLYQGEHPAGQEPLLQHYLRTFHRFGDYPERVYQPEIFAQIQAMQNLYPQDWLLTALDLDSSASSSCSSLLHRLRRANLMLKGAQNIHPRATALGFAHGLVVRSPFCDLALADWTFSLSGELCLQGACEKYILKRAVEDWLPREIVWRQKRGMGVPLTSWCLNEFWYDLGKWLNPGILSIEGHFIPQIAAQIVTGELAGTMRGRRVGESLWLLIIWQLWRSHIFGTEPSQPSWNHPFLLPSWLWKTYKRVVK
jgi:asparagine synthase (glutamine-hydrolysing)